MLLPFQWQVESRNVCSRCLHMGKFGKFRRDPVAIPSRRPVMLHDNDAAITLPLASCVMIPQSLHCYYVFLRAAATLLLLQPDKETVGAIFSYAR